MKKLSGTMVALVVVAILIGTFIMSKSSTAGEKARDGRFIAYDDGTVLDTKTKLIWAAKDNESDINWADANSYCENYRGGGYKDWRMPTRDELEGLYDGAKNYKADCGFDVHLTELICLTCSFVWASEANGPLAAVFRFAPFRSSSPIGKQEWVGRSNVNFSRVLPVRSVK